MVFSGHCRIPLGYDMNYKALVRRRRGQCLIPPYRPCAKSDDNVVSDRGLSHAGGAIAAGVKSLLSVLPVIEHCLGKLYYSDMMWRLLPLDSSVTMNAAAPDGASCAADL